MESDGMRLRKTRQRYGNCRAKAFCRLGRCYRPRNAASRLRSEDRITQLESVESALPNGLASGWARDKRPSQRVKYLDSRIINSRLRQFGLEHAGRSSGRAWEDLGLPGLKFISQLVEHGGILLAEVCLLSLIECEIKKILSRAVVKILPTASTHGVLVRVAPEKSAIVSGACRDLQL